MILPNVRGSFGRDEAIWLVRLLAGDDSRERSHWESVLGERGIDPLLDDPRTLRALIRHGGVSLIPARLALYVFIRHAMVESGIGSRVLADYVTAMVLEFGLQSRAYRVSRYDDREYRYLVDILRDLADARGQREFLLRVHLGEFALWLSGLYPDYITARVHRRGGPGLDYYEEMGTTGYLLAADHPRARNGALSHLYRDAAETFGRVRRALNTFSDRFLLPRATSPVDRFLRQVATDVEHR